MNNDPVLDAMAEELRAVLVKLGLNPQVPPEQTNPPYRAAFAEYKRRGGIAYTDATDMSLALVRRTGELQRELAHARP